MLVPADILGRDTENELVDLGKIASCQHPIDPPRNGAL
jgi:hypothetical protein